MSAIATIDVSKLDEDGRAIAFQYTDAFGQPARGVIVRFGGDLYAYRNRCPHQSMPLDAGSGQFFDAGDRVLQCQRHGARFDPATGECIMGPCEGDRLDPLRVEVSDDQHTATIHRGGGLSLG